MCYSQSPIPALNPELGAPAKELLRRAYVDLNRLADAVEDCDERLAELLLCCSELLDGYARQRGQEISDDAWLELDVDVRTTLRVMERIMTGESASDTPSAAGEVDMPRPASCNDSTQLATVDGLIPLWQSLNDRQQA